MGATVDYAILFTTHYLDLRKETSSKKAIHTAMGETFKSILVSGSVLAIAGLALNISSSNPIVGELGMLLARGTLLSMFMVFCLLPALLRIFDGVIRRTTCKAGFFKAKEINFNGKETKQ
ncbi:MMPL family transporter [Muricomes intestini]|uniref:MMPL family transporter n=1 Tax=Muricomes intestini TaxID=1796634 RepID=UPI002FDF15F5